MQQTITVLCIEGKAVEFEGLKTILAAPHFHLIKAAEPAVWGASLRTKEIDIVLSAVAGNGLAPFQILELVREHNPTLPVLLLTPGSSIEEAVQALQRGATDYMVATTTALASLPARIQGLLERPHPEAHRGVLAGQAQRHSEARFLHTFEHSPIAIAIVRRSDGRHLNVNESFSRMFGYRREEVLGRTTLELGLYADPGERERLLGQLAHSGAIHNQEFRGRTRAGEVIEVLLSAEVIEDDEEPYLIIQSYDITARKEVQSRFEQQIRRAHVLAELSQAFAEVSLDYNSALNQVARRIARLFDDFCVVGLFSDDREWLNIAAISHPDSQLDAKAHGMFSLIRLPTNLGIFRKVLHEGIAILHNSLNDAPLFNPDTPLAHIATDEFQVGRLLAAPLQAQGTIFGALIVARRQASDAYSEDDRLFLDELAVRAALTLSNARLYEAAQEELAARRRTEAEIEQLNRSLEERVIERTEALHQVLRLQGAILDSASYAIITTTPDGIIHTFNPAAEQMFGYHAEQVIGSMTLIKLFQHDELHARADELASTIGMLVNWEYGCIEVQPAHRGHYENEWIFVRHDGSYFSGALAATPLYDGEGGMNGFLGIISDITERNEVAAELMRSEARLQFLLNRTPATIFTAQASGNYDATFVSDSIRDVLGYEPFEFIGEPNFWASHIHPDDVQRIFAEMPTLFAHGEHRYEYRFRHADGSYRWLRNGMTLVRDVYSQPREMVGYLIDVTDLKHAEETLRATHAELSLANAELLRASRLKDEFLANMSHELRTPLNSILGRAETLVEQMIGPLSEKQQNAVRSIAESGRHLLTLINDILDLSKIEAGRLELTLEDVHVAYLCQTCLRMVAEMALKKRVTLTSSVDEQLDFIRADERRLKQVLVNLLSNAVKFTSADGFVELRVQGDTLQGTIAFCVRDTGIGIAPEDQKRLFQPFVQLDSSLSRQYSGTGLGLALVARLAALHGGSVALESESGKGSCFTVTLPWRNAANMLPTPHKEAPAPVAAPATPVALPPAAAGQPLVLLAEDTPANAELLEEYLTLHGYQVVVARDGIAAVELAFARRPDLILMDVQMPRLDGLEAIRQIRARPGWDNIPIVALTALAMPGDRERCLEAGADAYLSKPVGLRELVQVVGQLVK